MPSASFRLIDLSWLPRPTDDFRARLRELENDTGADWGRALRRLATQALNLNQAIAVAKTLDRLGAQRPSPSLTPFRLGLVSNATTDFVRPLLVASCLRFGIALEVIAADFGQIVQEAVNPASRINQAKPDAVLIAAHPRGLPFRASGDAGWPLYDARAVLEEIAAAREGFRTHCGAPCLVQTIPAPAELLLGSLDFATPGTLRAAIAEVNSQLARDVPERGDVLIDVAWLAQSIGLDEWHDERQWLMARMPCAPQALPSYADFIARTIAALRGKSRKCLVLDLDNTLWGGVIGDDGLEGIALNIGDPRGEAFRSVQTVAADLRRRGVVLAVCSKNSETAAKMPFHSHPSMVLKEQDIAVFLANWDDKATNLERIARLLDIGTDALVLLDDNPAEREQVRQALPEVAVPELGDDPSLFGRTLLAAGYFESAAFTREDLARADQYRGNAQRAQAQAGARNLDDFLRSLEMEIEFAPFSATGRKRITQLINKTNQFNVTTRRYTEQQVGAVEESSDHYSLQVSLRDRFGDNGMIGVVICSILGERWEIDTWLMSCRVLNRKVEHAICNRIASAARQAGAKRLVGVYLPTERNGIVKDLFERLGFAEDTGAQPGQRWILELDGYAPHAVFFVEKPHPQLHAAASG